MSEAFLFCGGFLNRIIRTVRQDWKYFAPVSHPKISSRAINILIWLVSLHMVYYSGVLRKTSLAKYFMLCSFSHQRAINVRHPCKYGCRSETHLPSLWLCPLGLGFLDPPLILQREQTHQKYGIVNSGEARYSMLTYPGSAQVNEISRFRVSWTFLMVLLLVTNMSELQCVVFASPTPALLPRWFGLLGLLILPKQNSNTLLLCQKNKLTHGLTLLLFRLPTILPMLKPPYLPYELLSLASTLHEQTTC